MQTMEKASQFKNNLRLPGMQMSSWCFSLGPVHQHILFWCNNQLTFKSFWRRKKCVSTSYMHISVKATKIIFSRCMALFNTFQTLTTLNSRQEPIRKFFWDSMPHNMQHNFKILTDATCVFRRHVIRTIFPTSYHGKSFPADETDFDEKIQWRKFSY